MVEIAFNGGKLNE